MRQDLTDISIVLDRSSSMEIVRSATIAGFNKFLEQQQGQPGSALLTLCQFNTNFEMVHRGIVIAEVPPLSWASYIPAGATALLDAIGKTINQTGARLSAMAERDRPAKVLFVIITDGEENASLEFKSLAHIHQMITTQRDVYSWQFVFLGANQDAIQAGASLGIASNTSMTYASTPLGATRAFASMGNMTSSYRATGQAAFSDKDRQDQVDAAAGSASVTTTSTSTGANGLNP